MEVTLGTAYQNVCRKGHLWIVCSDPNESPHRILLLNVTSWKETPGSDDSCLVFPKDHPSISHKSYINYNLGEIRPLSHLRRIEDNGCIEEKEKASTELLEKIHQGAEITYFLDVNAIKLLKDQGFIEGNKHINVG